MSIDTNNLKGNHFAWDGKTYGEYIDNSYSAESSSHKHTALIDYYVI